MEERENKMAAGLEAAKQADDSLEEAKLTYEKELKEARRSCKHCRKGQQKIFTNLK